MRTKALLVIGASAERALYEAELIRAGIAVFSASTTTEATARCVSDGPFDLLIADVLIDGREIGPGITYQIRAFCPGLRVLFLDACPLGHLLQRDLLDSALFAGGHAAFLRRPLPVPVVIGRALGLLDSADLSVSVAVPTNGTAVANSSAVRAPKKRASKRAFGASGATAW